MAKNKGIVTVNVKAGQARKPTYNWGKGYVIRGTDASAETISDVEITEAMLIEAFGSK